MIKTWEEFLTLCSDFITPSSEFISSLTPKIYYGFYCERVSCQIEININDQFSEEGALKQFFEVHM